MGGILRIWHMHLNDSIQPMIIRNPHVALATYLSLLFPRPVSLCSVRLTLNTLVPSVLISTFYSCSPVTVMTSSLSSLSTLGLSQSTFHIQARELPVNIWFYLSSYDIQWLPTAQGETQSSFMWLVHNLVSFPLTSRVPILVLCALRFSQTGTSFSSFISPFCCL